jgi:glutamate 5-kinase
MRCEIVGKIGSMALIQRAEMDIDYNILSKAALDLRPGLIWVTSGAVEIGRLDYMKRHGRELTGEREDIKADYAAQGQSILMANYRQFARPELSLRQVLVEHQHFNDAVKREYIKKLLCRSIEQNTVPIINYNDPVSDEEIRKMELNSLRETNGSVVECVDNDETAAVICGLMNAKYLIILTSADGIYWDPADPDTLVRDVVKPDAETLTAAVQALKDRCDGASRLGANGARAKLEFALKPALAGATVIIANAKYHLDALIKNEAPQTRIGICG